MCGFAAVLRLTPEAPVAHEVVDRMTRVIHHRGPDDAGTYYSGAVGLGFRRLSILDTSPLGHQPMLSEDGQVALVFNGEIYNYVEVRAELEASGHRFKSTGDTEVLLRAYLEWGSECVKRFNGMWAFVIHDRRSGKVLGSRDRFGIKPLYRFRGGGCVLLASEIKSIRASGLHKGSTNWGVAARYLLEALLDDTTETFYTGIEQIAPGVTFEINAEGVYREWQYFALADVPRYDGHDPAGDFADLFEDAVRLHMRSDVPVGVHLSGGLDSTAIICASARLRAADGAREPLKAFSYIAPEFDESRYIADTIEQTGAVMVKLATDPARLWSILNEVLWYQDEPIYSMMPLVGYELMRLTRDNGVKVILNGQGADESLAGYPSYFADYWSEMLGAGRVARAWSEIGQHVAVHGGSRGGLFIRQARRLAQSRLGAVPAYRKLALWSQRRRRANNRWYSRQLTDEYKDNSKTGTEVKLDSALAYSIYRTPLPRILRVEDRNSMAHSVESRLPFLDYRLVSFALSLPADWRMRGPWNKFVLREGMRGRVPESVRCRVEKMGFPVPSANWIADALYEPVRDIVSSRQVRERGIYNVDTILVDLERHRRREVDVSWGLFNIAQFEAWAAL